MYDEISLNILFLLSGREFSKNIKRKIGLVYFINLGHILKKFKILFTIFRCAKLDWEKYKEGLRNIMFVIDFVNNIFPRGPKLEHYADKMREILIGWLVLLYLVCVLCQSA